MTKRLFAIVLAAILAITMFTFPVAAEVNISSPELKRDDTVETRLKLKLSAVMTLSPAQRLLSHSSSTVLSQVAQLRILPNPILRGIR